MSDSKDNEVSLSEQVYDGLRSQLLRGEFSVGQKIREADICDLFGVSRTPVREAMRMLQAEGILGATAGGRAVVTEPDLKQVEEIYDMREVIEALAAKLATKNAKTPDILEMQSILDDQKAGPDNEMDFLVINDRFHRALYRLSDNRYIQRTAEILLNSASMVRGSTHGRYDFESWSLHDHERIFKAIAAGDTNAAAEAAKDHIRRGREQRIKLILSRE